MNEILDLTDDYNKAMEEMEETEVDELTDLENQMYSMIDKKNEKLELGRTSLINMLEVTRDKFKTVNGTNHVYQAMLDAKLYKNFDCPNLICWANDIATNFAEEFDSLVNDITDENSIEDIQELFLDRFYTRKYKFDGATDFIDELIAIQMVREIDGTCNDLLEFQKVAEEEIDKVVQKIAELENAD